MIEMIEVPRPERSPSQVVVGDVLSQLESYLPTGRRVVVITDEQVLEHYKGIIARYDYLTIPQGEERKSLDTVAPLYAQLLEMGVDRSTYIVGFGGGIVTDVAGFVASTYLRGLSFGFVASTLLAQVDASVGGKNGVNFEGYKNMVGTFNQPDFVLCDTSLLATLPEREFRAGLAEVIKSGLIADTTLFELFEKHTYAEFREELPLLREAISRAIRVKASVVAQDEREQGERRKLNLGHTFGHAVEKRSREFLHGEAVAIGMAMIAERSVAMGLLTPSDCERVVAVLKRMGLPTQSGVALQELLVALKKDKKKEGEGVRFVLLNGIGSCTVQHHSFDEIDSWGA